MTETPSRTRQTQAPELIFSRSRRDGADCQPALARGMTGAAAAQPRGSAGMNFASDNGAGVAPPILDAIVGVEPRQRARLRRRRLDRARRGALERNLRARGVGLSRRHRHRRQRAGARRAGARRGRRCSATKKRMSSTTNAARRNSSPPAPSSSASPAAPAKFTPRRSAETLARFPRGLAKTSQPGALSLSQATEAGTAYRLDEIAALAAIAREAGMGVHMDGARFANVAGRDRRGAGGAHLARRRRRAVVRRDQERRARLRGGDRLRSRQGRRHAVSAQAGGQTLSKGRFLGAQMEAWLAGDLWLELARRANGAARRLAEGLAAAPGLRLAFRRRGQRGFRRRARRERSRAGARRGPSSTTGRRARRVPISRPGRARRWRAW